MIAGGYGVGEGKNRGGFEGCCPGARTGEVEGRDQGSSLIALMIMEMRTILTCTWFRTGQGREGCAAVADPVRGAGDENAGEGQRESSAAAAQLHANVHAKSAAAAADAAAADAISVAAAEHAYAVRAATRVDADVH